LFHRLRDKVLAQSRLPSKKRSVFRPPRRVPVWRRLRLPWGGSWTTREGGIESAGHSKGAGLIARQAVFDRRAGASRPRSEERRDAVLKAAMQLMQEDDLRMASVDRISARSGVSKATIYKWWPNRTAVAIDAFLHQMMTDAPVPDTGSAAEDFRLTLHGMMQFYTSPRGAIYAQLVGES